MSGTDSRLSLDDEQKKAATDSDGGFSGFLYVIT
jgi:hypothetical protein